MKNYFTNNTLGRVHRVIQIDNYLPVFKKENRILLDSLIIFI